MTFETPVQPVRTRPARVGLVLAALVAAAGMLVWQPWSAGSSSGSPNDLSARHPSPPRDAAALPAIATTVPSSVPIVPTADRFRPRWSVAGVTEQPDGSVTVVQLPVVLTSEAVEPRSAAEICEIGRARSAIVAMLPSDHLRLIGVAAPAAELQGPVEIVQIDRPILTVYEIPVPPAAEGDGAARALPSPDPSGAAVAETRLFVRSDLLPWLGGAYRFATAAIDGTEHYLYACVTKGATAGW